MISLAQIESFRQWFHGYVHSFPLVRDDEKFNFQLKEEHTNRVCGEILEIGRSLGLSEDDLRLAETAALFHDVGRFPQYARYNTFLDYKSEDHAALGVAVLKEQNVLAGLEATDREIISHAVLFHNRAELPDIDDERTLLFSRMVRDADKLDIGLIYSNYYHDRSIPRNPALELNRPDNGEITPAICERLLAGRSVKNTEIHTLNDLKLVQMGQVYDVNFRRTFELIAERKYLEKFNAALPQNSTTRTIYEHMRDYVRKRLAEKR
jgi:hypothetical protein